MRRLTLTLHSADGKLEAAESTFCASTYQPSGQYLRVMLDDLMHRLDVLERDGPWNNGQPSAGKEGPAVFHEKK